MTTVVLVKNSVFYVPTVYQVPTRSRLCELESKRHSSIFTRSQRGCVTVILTDFLSFWLSPPFVIFDTHNLTVSFGRMLVIICTSMTCKYRCKMINASWLHHQIGQIGTWLHCCESDDHCSTCQKFRFLRSNCVPGTYTIETLRTWVKTALQYLH